MTMTDRPEENNNQSECFLWRLVRVFVYAFVLIFVSLYVLNMLWGLSTGVFLWWPY